MKAGTHLYIYIYLLALVFSTTYAQTPEVD